MVGKSFLARKNENRVIVSSKRRKVMWIVWRKHRLCTLNSWSRFEEVLIKAKVGNRTGSKSRIKNCTGSKSRIEWFQWASWLIIWFASFPSSFYFRDLYLALFCCFNLQPSVGGGFSLHSPILLSVFQCVPQWDYRSCVWSRFKPLSDWTCDS